MAKLSIITLVSVACAREAETEVSTGSVDLLSDLSTTDSAQKIANAKKHADRQDKCWEDHGSNCCATPRPVKPPTDGTELYICNECCCDVEDLITAAKVSQCWERHDYNWLDWLVCVISSISQAETITLTPVYEPVIDETVIGATPEVIIDTIEYCPIPDVPISGDTAFGVCMNHWIYAEAQTDCFVAEYSSVEVTTQAGDAGDLTTVNIGNINHVPVADRDDPDPSHDSSLSQGLERLWLQFVGVTSSISQAVTIHPDCISSVNTPLR